MTDSLQPMFNKTNQPTNHNEIRLV